MLIYVDDVLITGSSSSLIQQFISKLSSIFAFKDLSLIHYFFRLEAKIFSDIGMFLSQMKYMYDLLYVQTRFMLAQYQRLLLSRLSHIQMTMRQ